MSSGFISEAELAEQRRVRQEQWEKVRKPGQPEECPEEDYDHRSLFERLEEQKRKRELEYEEAHKLKNMIKGLDDDEVEFLDLVDRSKLEEERRKSAEEAREINDFRNAVASLQERSLEERIQSEIRTRPVVQTASTCTRSSQMRLLAGAVVRKRPADPSTQEVNEKKVRTDNKIEGVSMNGSESMSNSKEENRASISSMSTPTVKAKCEETSSSAEVSNKRKNIDNEDENSDSNSLGLRCIGILPGLGSYPDSSDSEQSSDTDQELNGSGTYDLLGRKIIRQSKSKSTTSTSSMHKREMEVLLSKPENASSADITSDGCHAEDESEFPLTGSDSQQVAMVEQLQQADQTHAGDLVFEDEQHNSRTLQALNMMRKNRHFCDVVLHVGNTEFHGHRAVLASASPYLFELFTADDENKGSQRETIITYKLNGGFEKSALEKLIHYAYTAKLEVSSSQVKAVYLAACHLKMDRVVKECIQHLIKNLSVDNCIEIRSLPGISRNKAFVDQVDMYIAKEFDKVCQSKILLSLPCVCVEVLNQTRQEMSLVVGESLAQLVLEWIKRQCDSNALNMDELIRKTHLLYLAMDNSLQDCSELPTGDVSDTEIVQDYKKLSKKNQSNIKGRRKGQMQPAKPRVLIYSRDIGDRAEQQKESDWNLISTSKVGEHTFLALMTVNGLLTRLSVMLRLNQPSSPSPITTPIASRPVSEEKPDLYCMMPNMSSVKCAAGCANLNNSLLVCGGYDRGECLKDVELYDPETNLWATLASMREARGRFDIAVVNGKVYAVGGSNGTTELATVEMYDPQEKKWSQITSLPLARCNIGVCDLNDKIYCIGGWNGQVGIKQCDVFDPVTRQWTSIAPLQTGRYQAGVCAMDGYVFAVGGCDAWNCLSSVEVYDPHTNMWTYAKGMITARRGCGLAVFKGKLYAVGGSDGTHSLCSTEIYDPQEKTWTPGPNMTTARANVGVAFIGGRLYAVGGFSGKTFLNSIEYLDEKTDEWTTFVPKMMDNKSERKPELQYETVQKNGTEEEIHLQNAANHIFSSSHEHGDEPSESSYQHENDTRQDARVNGNGDVFNS